MRAASDVFVRSGGFRRTQIGEVAEAMGVAKGTVYLYVESKEALFDLVLRYADDPTGDEPALPFPTPQPGETVAFLRTKMAQSARFERLADACERPNGSATSELGAIVDELYATLAAHRYTIRLVNASALDMPELSDLWFAETRRALNERLATYIERRQHDGVFNDALPPFAAARLLTETAHWFAVQRHFDPFPDALDDELAAHTVREAAIRTLRATP